MYSTVFWILEAINKILRVVVSVIALTLLMVAIVILFIPGLLMLTWALGYEDEVFLIPD